MTGPVGPVRHGDHMNPQDHEHYWYPVSEPVTLERVAFEELAMRARPEPHGVRVLCDCGAVEWR